MKKCNKCGVLVNDTANFCNTCGSADFSLEETQNNVNAEPIVSAPVNNEQPLPLNNGNVIAGIFGALLLSLVGVALYFIVYQIGFIAGICGLVIFLLAKFGYGLFAKPSNKNSIIAIVVSIITMVIMIFVAEYLCLAYEIYEIYKPIGITIVDAIFATPDFLAEPDVMGAVAGDLVFAYVFGGIASISNIVNAKKKK